MQVCQNRFQPFFPNVPNRLKIKRCSRCKPHGHHAPIAIPGSKNLLRGEKCPVESDLSRFGNVHFFPCLRPLLPEGQWPPRTLCGPHPPSRQIDRYGSIHPVAIMGRCQFVYTTHLNNPLRLRSTEPPGKKKGMHSIQRQCPHRQGKASIPNNRKLLSPTDRGDTDAQQHKNSRTTLSP